MANKDDEIIVVVPRKALFENENFVFQGTASDDFLVKRLMGNIGKNFGTMRRGDAEVSERFKQLIPYAVIRQGDRYFMYKRLEGGGEEKLHGKLSLGVGGHVNYNGNTEKDVYNIIATNLSREIEEELIVSDTDMKTNIVGFINDDLNEVGRVHIGVLCIVDVALGETVEVRETDALEGFWVTLNELKQGDVYGRLEDWSKIVVQTLDK